MNHVRKPPRSEPSRYALLCYFSDTILFEYNYETQAIDLTPNALECFALTTTHIARPFEDDCDESPIHPDDRPLLRAFVENGHALGDGEIREIELRGACRDGEYHDLRCQARFVPADGHQAHRMVGKVSDVSTQKERERALIERSALDPLTGAYNKAVMESRIDRILESEKTGCFFMIDVDDFKSVNDRWGHLTGDQVLARFAQLLMRDFRANDLVGRVGGDEFAVYMNGAVNPRSACERAQKLIRQAADLKHSSGAAVSISVGLAFAPLDGATYAALYAAADRAMYQAKRNGKNQCALSRDFS